MAIVKDWTVSNVEAAGATIPQPVEGDILVVSGHVRIGDAAVPAGWTGHRWAPYNTPGVLAWKVADGEESTAFNPIALGFFTAHFVCSISSFSGFTAPTRRGVGGLISAAGPANPVVGPTLVIPDATETLLLAGWGDADTFSAGFPSNSGGFTLITNTNWSGGWPCIMSTYRVVSAPGTYGMTAGSRGVETLGTAIEGIAASLPVVPGSTPQAAILA